MAGAWASDTGDGAAAGSAEGAVSTVASSDLAGSALFPLERGSSIQTPQPTMMAATSHSRLRPKETLAIVTARASRSPVPATRPNPIRSSLAFMTSPMAAAR